MTRRDRVLPALFGALLSGGCDGAGQQPVTPTAAVALPAAITITTNEPFHAAAIEGAVLRLSGVDMAERRMAVVVRDAVPGGWRWRARDAMGEVVATVTKHACADDMSGIAREFSGELRIDGRSVRGCAFRTPTDRIPGR